jgi:putative Holliday junction resolvase
MPPTSSPDRAVCASGPPAGRVLGLDYGSKRIGLALSDEAGRIAFPAGALERKGRERDLAALRDLAQERGVVAVVVGLPIHMNGRRGPEAEAAEAFGRAVAEFTGLRVETFDERWTSRQAERTLRELGRPRARTAPGEVDALAATLLLQAWLDRASRNAGRDGRST